MKLARRPRRGPSRFWAALYRLRVIRYHMPFWRVVAECRPMRMLRHWPADAETAVTAVFVWARTSEEAEGLAALALEREGLAIVTADAVKAAPGARPRKAPAAIARTDYSFLARMHGPEPAAPPPRRGARA